MTIATLVVAPSVMIESATAWAGAGLVGDSFWVASDHLDEIDVDRPNDIMIKWLRLGEQPQDGPLAVMLASLASLQEARVVWVRTTTDACTERLADLAALLHGLFPYVRTHWLDIVVPQTRTDERVNPLAGEWVQFRVHPSDRPAPNASDAGWDRGLEVPLHTTLAVAGILGGVTTNLPWATRSAAKYHVVRVFSRMVGGGLVARQQATEFVHDTLPVTDAAQQHPAAFLLADEPRARAIVDETTNWILGQAKGVLQYRAPSASKFASKERVSLGRHLLQFGRFVPIGLMTLVGLRPEPDAVVSHVLEFDDLGYSIGPEIPVVKWTHGVPDFAALEQEAISAAEATLTEARLRDGAQPPAGVWEPLSRVVTALVDGGEAVPTGWEVPVSQDRRLVLPPDRVLLGAEEHVSSRVPELKSVRNRAVAHQAFVEAQRVHGDVVQADADPTRVTVSAERLARQANQTDNDLLYQQLAELGSEPEIRAAASLLERVHGTVLGGVIRSRLDAERWSRAATTAPPGNHPDWHSATKPLRRIFGTLILLLVTLALVWWFWHPQISSWLGISVGAGTGLLVIGTVVLLVIPLAVYLLFRKWLAHTERGRRRLELLGIWLSRTLAALRAHAGLKNTERVVRAWGEVLTDVPGRRAAQTMDAFDSEVDNAPMAMRIGQPRFKEQQMDRWLAEAGAPPGWRLAALQEVAGRHTGVAPERALGTLSGDQGLPGGKLATLIDGLDEYVDEWADSTSRTLAESLRHCMTEQLDQLRVTRSPQMAPQDVQIRDFLAELEPDRDEDDWPDDEIHSWVVRVLPGETDDSAPRLRLTEAFCEARVRIQVRESDGATDELPVAPEMATFGGHEPAVFR